MYITLQEETTDGLINPTYSLICGSIFFATLIVAFLTFIAALFIYSRQSRNSAEKNIWISYKDLINSLKKDETKNKEKDVDISKEYWIFKSDLSKTKKGRKIVKKLRKNIYESFDKNLLNENAYKILKNSDKFFEKFLELTQLDEMVEILNKKITLHRLEDYMQKYKDNYKSYYIKKNKMKETFKKLIPKCCIGKKVNIEKNKLIEIFKKLDYYFNLVLNVSGDARRIVREEIEEIYIEYLKKINK